MYTFDRRDIHTQLADFFTEKWSNGIPKEYTDRKSNTGKADRYVARQPLVYKDSSDGQERVVFNLRKMNELCYHLCKIGTPQQFDRLKKEVLCNFDWLYEKMRAMGIMR